MTVVNSISLPNSNEISVELETTKYKENQNKFSNCEGNAECQLQLNL